ncbi:MAG: CDP-alcohol phosphatidyltransferase family protein [Rickettsiales bacterium]|jgi:CDP-diacylglycerol--glycerol-3-phosphate 3-phosphatidyltransferase|nr:CDP-alcohol phosphatidyltransferase family protein [Rickettsiales bacterium]
MKYFVNFLSVFRIVAAFAIAPLLMDQMFASAFALFVLASATDWLDGFLARKFNVATKIGGVIDHIGDKFLVANALVMMVMFLQIWYVIIPATLMICRELYVSGLREFLGTQKIEMPVPKSRFSLGKIKALVQMLAISAMMLWIWAVNADWNSEFMTYHLLWASIGGLWLALACSLASAAQYTAAFAKNLKKIK